MHSRLAVRTSGSPEPSHPPDWVVVMSDSEHRLAPRPRTTPTLPLVSVRHLSRKPAHVLDRVAAGERFIVTRHGTPIATIQPLSGSVFQPIDQSEHDVYGRPHRDAKHEVARLSDLQRRLLRDAVTWDKIIAGRVGRAGEDWCAALEEMRLLGLVRRSPRGWVLKGRGLVLREVLLAQAGQLDDIEKVEGFRY